MELRDARSILCIQPHYDDNDLGAGGTIAALHDAGCQVVYLTVTDDLVGVKDESSNIDAYSYANLCPRINITSRRSCRGIDKYPKRWKNGSTSC